ncbi:conserved hypothetical protein [Hyella patelloides LEGE 07179]|uniref:Glycosyl hydrolase-like 10 domain-containing protein n=1 Tax=Hyella patelloides LEGE 07179 TaxID=945734 RepID=A0A563VRL6_9CYAN|nr:family 10 glycosylhydrolase [Hyella patelloides]VEP14100.1 conserved hypothetical protein [Hyella patelloides LEGE 07179]
MTSKKKPNGCGCANIPISVILLFIGGGYWAFSKYGIPDVNHLVSRIKGEEVAPALTPTPTLPAAPIIENPNLPTSPVVPSTTPNNSNSPQNNLPTTPVVTAKPQHNNQPVTPPKTTPQPDNEAATPPETNTQTTKPIPVNNWQQKEIRGIYFSRYQITNNASEAMIRQRVRYYKSQGINTIIHGVWGNACTMYNSEVMQQKLGFKSCPNLFRDRWLNWLIDEAHKQGMEVHAYFEKGIKIDKNSPIFDLAVDKKWLVPGVDRTYAGVDHYVLDVENPEVANFFRDILVEFVKKYPEIDAVQWDDYLGYHAELPGKVDRTEHLTKFVQEMISAMKEANPNVSFDICHHNPYWAKRYFAADWKKWGVDRVFIQAYNEKGFKEELNYVKKYDGVAITDRQFHRLPQLIESKAVKSILVFPLSGKPEITAAELKTLTEKNN